MTLYECVNALNIFLYSLKCFSGCLSSLLVPEDSVPLECKLLFTLSKKKNHLLKSKSSPKYYILNNELSREIKKRIGFRIIYVIVLKRKMNGN